MIRIQENKTECEKRHGNICPSVLRKLKKSINSSAYCHAIWNGDDGYEVTHQYTKHRFSVNLVEKTCSCRYWQLSGLPCPHAITCIFLETNILDGYISKSYTIDSFKKSFAHCLQPVEGQLAWLVSDRPRPVGPKESKKPGRKKKNRTREEQEKPKSTRVSKVGTVIKCGLCKRPGHNRSSCYKRHGIDSTSTAAPVALSGSANPPNPPAMVHNKVQQLQHQINLLEALQIKERGRLHLKIPAKQMKLKTPRKGQEALTLQVVALSMCMEAPVLLSMLDLDITKLLTSPSTGTGRRNMLECATSWVSKIDVFYVCLPN